MSSVLSFNFSFLKKEIAQKELFSMQERGKRIKTLSF